MFGKTVEDAALGLGVIAGHDPNDSTSVDRPVPKYRNASGDSLKGLVIGRPREYFTDALDPRIKARCDEAAERLQSLGAEVRDVSLPHTSLAIPSTTSWRAPTRPPTGPGSTGCGMACA